jgi:hypothetical protein
MPPAKVRPESLADDQIKSEFQDLFSAAKDLAFTALQDKAMNSVRDTVRGVTERLNEYVEEGGGGPGLMAAVRGAEKLSEGASPGRAMLGAGAAGLKGKLGNLFGRGGKGKGGQGRGLKLTNIVESIDVGVPVQVAYNQWTQFADFPKFMKKVESVDNPSDEKLQWKAQVFWSHRNWESTIMRQIPDEQIVWRSKGQKGHVDGAVSFHELAPNLTRVLLVLEYHPQGFFERTGNLWRAQGRRARLELKHFRRHVMTQVALHPDEVGGWRGVIEDGKVVKDHQTAVEEEERDREQEEEGQPEAAAGEEAPEDRADEAGEEELPEDEAGEEGLPEDEAGTEGLPEDEAEEEEPPEDEAGTEGLPEDEADEEEPPEDEGGDEDQDRGAAARRRASRAPARSGSGRETRQRRPAAARTGRGRT